MTDPFSDRHKQAVNNELEQILSEAVRTAGQQSTAYRQALQQLRQLSGRGGKRLRPLLLLMTYEGYGGSEATSVRVAAAVELLHTFLLIHDDIIDRDNMRWGDANIQGCYFERYSRDLPAREAMHLAQSQALLIGDACLMLAQQTLLGTSFNPALLTQAQTLVLQATSAAISGEVTEIALTRESRWPSPAQIEKLYAHKTASYSFELPLQLGGLLAGVSTAELKQLAAVGRSLGIAYQLQDDVLDMFADAGALGKSVANDLQEAKRTAIMAATMQLAAPADRAWLRAALGRELDASDLVRVRQLIRDCGAHDQIKQQIHNYHELVKKRLLGLHLSKPAQRRMLAFVNDLAQRIET